MTLDRGRDTEIGEPKYARIEYERRFLIDPGARPPLEAADFTLIEDLYIAGTRLRLRRMSQRAAGRTVWKLTKKYDTGRPEARPIVTAYLTEAEFEVFARLPGSSLRKRRTRVGIGGSTWSLDLFEGRLSGLETVEAEADDEARLDALVPPPWATREITGDPRYQCGSLARLAQLPEDLWPVS